jgi:iron(III) transport system substrate-binding protein
MIRPRGGAADGFIRDRTLVLLGIIAVVGLTAWRLNTVRNSLVVYCAHDAVFSDEILREFEKRTGIKVFPRYDTEATKSLGLTELIIREREAPRCDVFWNNEVLGTMDLAERGLLEPYRGDGWRRIPDAWKDANGNWTGFAARMRVLIVNTKNESSGGTAPDPMLGNPNLERVAIAKPLYGTTLTHYIVLWQEWGADRLQTWHRDTRARGLREVNGNGPVKQIVAQGTCDSGLTDTDDFFDATDNGAPVRMIPVQLEGGATICIPNTVAIIRGTRRMPQAQRFADFLLSSETETALARSEARQIPLGSGIPEGAIPSEVRDLATLARTAVPLTGMLKARGECLTWLKSIYAE